VAVANTLALSIARPWEAYPGLVDRERGIILEDAVAYTIERLIDSTSVSVPVELAVEALAEAGIAGVSSMSCLPAEARALRRLEMMGALRVRVSCYPEPSRLAVHAIGDAALDEVLDGFESASKCNCRVEHASIAWPGQIRRLAGLGVYTVVQPHFRVSDWWIDKRLGPNRLGAAYPLASMSRSGVKLAFSTDAPVEPYQPWETVAAALGRCEQPACRPEESLTPREAIEAYTIRAAEASGGPVARLGRLCRSAPAALAYTPKDPLDPGWSGPLKLLYHGV